MNRQANLTPVDPGTSFMAHAAGFGAGLLAMIGVVIGTVVLLWIGHALEFSAAAGQWIAGSGMLGALVAFYRTWKQVATEIRRRHSPAGLAASQAEQARVRRELAQSEAGELPERYCFYDDAGQVILETDRYADVRQAIVAGVITGQTACSSASTSSRPAARKPLVQSKLAAWPGVTDLLFPLSNPRLIGASIGCCLGLLLFVGIWIGATFQGNLAQSSWPTYFGILAVLAVLAMAAGVVLGVVGGNAFGLKQLRNWGLPVERCGERPIGEGALSTMILGAGLVLGGLLTVALVPF